MRNKLSYITFLFLVVQIASCKKIPPPTNEMLPVERFHDNIVITGTQYTSKIGNKLYFDVSAVSLKNGKSHNMYHDSAFQNYSQTAPSLTIEVQSVDRNESQLNLSYDVILLIDLTQPDFASWVGPEFLNHISRIIRICNQSPDKNIAVGYFARNVNGNEQVIFCQNPVTGGLFDNDVQYMIEFLGQNFEKIGQFENSSMLDAVNVSVDKLVEYSQSANKSIVLINGNDDDGQSSITSSQLSQKCIANNVSVNYINWGQNYCGYIQMALETGGFYGVTNSIGQFESVVFCIHELLSKNYSSYSLHCMASRPQSWVANSSICAALDVFYYEEIDCWETATILELCRGPVET